MDADRVRHVFVRHPPLAGVQGLCYGRLDIGLDAAVLDSHAPALASGLPEWPVVSSPSRRCAALARALNRGQVRLDTRLQEMDFGDWEGLPWAEVPRDLLDAWSRDVVGFRPPGGESFLDLVQRVGQALSALHTPHIVITHGGVIRAAWHLLDGIEPIEAARLPVAHARPIALGACAAP